MPSYRVLLNISIYGLAFYIIEHIKSIASARRLPHPVNLVIAFVPYNANEPASASSADSAGWQTMLPRTLLRSILIR